MGSEMCIRDRTETGLEIISQEDLEFDGGYLGSITKLKTPEGFESSGSKAFQSIFAVVTNGTDVIVMNGYTFEDEPDHLDAMEQIAKSMRLEVSQ